VKYGYFHASLKNDNMGLSSKSNWVSKILPNWKNSRLKLCNVTYQTPKIEMRFPILLFVSNLGVQFGDTKQWYSFYTERLLIGDKKVVDYAMSMTLELRRTISKPQNAINEQGTLNIKATVTYLILFQGGQSCR
jgi:hypothetical protein